MPLLRKKPFTLSESPCDLEPEEPVYQVRFTKEIFCGYQDYLNRINLYRQRVWTCRITGKSNLTYEEALVSEKDATEKVQRLPEELIAPALCIIQFSTLPLKDLADTIAAKMQDCLFVGAELYGKADNDVYPCKILKIVDSPEKTCYEVEWLDRKKKTTGNALLTREDLVHKRSPFSRSLLKSFIRESTYRGTPWVLHDKLAVKYGISTDPPKHLKDDIAFKDGLVIGVKKRKKNEDGVNTMVKDEDGKYKRKKVEKVKVDGSILDMNSEQENDHLKEGVIKYPIDDLLVQPGPDDPVFSDRPSPSRDFKVPMDCVGDLLMVWDFCSSFSKLLHLWPFSLEDFENAVCHKDGNVVLIVECHAALLRLLLTDNDEYRLAVRKKRRSSKISLVTWTEYLCDFLELIDVPEVHASISTIKRGHYGTLDARAKLGIYQELVNQALETDIVREKLDQLIEQRHALGATRRGEALEEARKRKEEKERFRGESHENGLTNGHLNSVKSKSDSPAQDNHCEENGDALEKGNGEATLRNNALKDSECSYSDNSKKSSKKQSIDPRGSLKDHKELPKDSKDHMEVNGKSSKEQRKQYYEREMEKLLIRTNPLGKDRHYNRYWWFRRDGRIFVESLDSKEWGYYSTREELHALMESLNLKGERERALKKQLEKFYSRIGSELQKRSKDLAHRIAEEEAVLRRSTRVRAPPRDNPATAFLRYVNKWKEA